MKCNGFVYHTVNVRDRVQFLHELLAMYKRLRGAEWKSNLSGIEAVLKTECSCESGWGSSPQASSMVQILRKEGWILNPNDKVVNSILKRVEQNKGLCPCQNDSEDKHCPCSNYRVLDHCCCGLYKKLGE